MRPPLISVVIPCYNNAHYIEAAINSVLTQTVSDLELIVIDDGSSDGSAERARQNLDKFNNPDRLRLIVQENRGICRSLNTGLSMAQGHYFSCLDSDDLWAPTKLEKQIAAMESYKQGVGASFTDAYIIDGEGKRVGRFGRQYKYHGGNIFEDLIRSRFCPPWSSNLFIRQKLISAGGFDEAIPIQDFNVWVRLSRLYSVVYVPEPLVSYRVHATNISTSHPDKVFKSSLYTLERVLQEEPSLLPLRRQILGRVYAHRAGSYYNALKLQRARREALKALQVYPLDSLAWRIILRSMAGSTLVRKLRGCLRSRREQQSGASL